MKNNKCIDCNSEIEAKSKRCIICRNRMIAKLNFGSKNSNWKGELASYKTKHQRINAYYGKANKCENKNCTKKSNFYEWANVSGLYYRYREDWIMLCHSCNIRMDYYRKYGNKCKNGHEYNKENTRINKNSGKRQCRVCKRKVK